MVVQYIELYCCHNKKDQTLMMVWLGCLAGDIYYTTSIVHHDEDDVRIYVCMFVCLYGFMWSWSRRRRTRRLGVSIEKREDENNTVWRFSKAADHFSLYLSLLKLRAAKVSLLCAETGWG